MSFETIQKENLDTLLREVAKEYRKLAGKNMPAEMILVGGAAVICNYGFREMTTDIDAMIMASDAMKDAIRHVGDRLHLPFGWLNDDFRKTESFSPKLREISVYYKSYYGVLSVRTVAAEYLVAMKIKSGRKYKNDLSDIVGIVADHQSRGDSINEERVIAAFRFLYGLEAQIPEENLEFLRGILLRNPLTGVYEEIRNNEKNAKEALIEFQAKYPSVLKTENVNTIIATLQEKKKKENKQ